MEKLISKILLLCALIGVAFGAYSYVQERPSKLIDELKGDLDRDLAAVKSEKMQDIDKLKAEFKEGQRALADAMIQRLDKIDKGLEKLDDRLFEMQKRQLQDARLRAGEVISEDI